jgi:methylmalonyl-CoA/ethylmalonyl-CoA epimerase
MLDPARFRFHHLGVACRDLGREAEVWEKLGYAAEGPDFVDPLQKIRGRFIVGLGPRLELLEPVGPGSPIDGVLSRGGKLYHQGFETFDFDAALTEIQAAGLRPISPPTPAVAFGGRRICFLMSPTLNLIEIIEAAP